MQTKPDSHQGMTPAPAPAPSPLPTPPGQFPQPNSQVESQVQL